LDASIIEVLNFGTAVEVVKEDDNFVTIAGVEGKWVYIERPVRGWVFNAFLDDSIGQAGFNWLADGRGGLIISGYFGDGGSITIPAHINGIPISAIGRAAFQGKNLTSVTIADGITEIRSHAFAENQLMSVSLPESIKFIGETLAFWDTPITSITIGANVMLGDAVIGKQERVNPSRSEPRNHRFNEAYNNNEKRAGTYTRSNADSDEWAWSGNL
jgi:hypothetical protein